MKKIILFTLLFIFILIKSLSTSNDASAVPVFDPVVNEDEMHHFFRVWSEYLQSDVQNFAKDKVSLKNGKPSEVLPKKVILWLEERGFDADRFFYVEDRLNAVVKTALVDYHIEKMTEILQYEKSKTKAKDKDTRLSIDRMLEVQERNKNIEKVTPSEISMVNQNLPLIEDILSGKTFYMTFITII